MRVQNYCHGASIAHVLLFFVMNGLVGIIALTFVKCVRVVVALNQTNLRRRKLHREAGMRSGEDPRQLAMHRYTLRKRDRALKKGRQVIMKIGASNLIGPAPARTDRTVRDK